MLDFVKYFLYIIWYGQIIFLFPLICVVCDVDLFSYIKPFLHPWDKALFIIMFNYLMCYWIRYVKLLCFFLQGFFFSCFLFVLGGRGRRYKEKVQRRGQLSSGFQKFRFKPSMVQLVPP